MAYFNECFAGFFKEPKEALQKIRNFEFTSDIVCVGCHSKNIFFGLDKKFYNFLPEIIIDFDSKFYIYNGITYVDGSLPTLREQAEEKLREIERIDEKRTLVKYEESIKEKLESFHYIELEEIVDMLNRVRMKFIYYMDSMQRWDYFDSKRREREERKRKKRERMIKKGIQPYDSHPGQKGLFDF